MGGLLRPCSAVELLSFTPGVVCDLDLLRTSTWRVRGLDIKTRPSLYKYKKYLIRHHKTIQSSLSDSVGISLYVNRISSLITYKNSTVKRSLTRYLNCVKVRFYVVRSETSFNFDKDFTYSFMFHIKTFPFYLWRIKSRRILLWHSFLHTTE